MDPIAAKGFAQVFEPSGQRMAALNLRERQRQFNATQEAAIRKADMEWLDGQAKELKLNPGLSFENKKRLAYKLQDVYKTMNEFSKKSIMGTSTIEDKLAFQKEMQDLKMAEGFVVAFDDSMRNVVEAAEKNKALKRDAIATASREAYDRLWTKDEWGMPKPDLSTEDPSTILENPDMYDHAILNNEFIDQFTVSQEEFLRDPASGLQTVQDRVKYQEAFYDIDPNTGKFTPKATPENIRMYDSDPIRAKILDKQAMAITPEGEDWKKYRAKAFEQNVIGQFAGTSSEKTITNKPEYLYSQGEATKIGQDRYRTINTIAYSGNDSDATREAGRLFNPESGLKAEVVRLTPSISGSESAPSEKYLVIKKWQKVDGTKTLDNPLGTADTYDWIETERIPLNTDKERDESIFKINAMFPDAAKDKEKFDKVIRREHDAFKSTLKKPDPKPITDEPGTDDKPTVVDSDAAYKALKPGTVYIGPDGVKRKKK